MASTTIDTGVETHHGHEEPNYLQAKKGLMSWVITYDHKRIGMMYLLAILAFFLVGGLLAIGVRTFLLTPDGLLESDGYKDLYNRVFTLHGAIMVFLVIVPSIPASLGNFVLPLALGAKDVAFPKLNLASFHIYVVGALFMLYAVISHSLDTGWTFYTPYSSTTNTAVIAPPPG